ncbi:MAG TPA: PAS domain-containing sensor histidine kinase [Aquihabitans sp.]|nr:PAS domain-containing sensor histidine kinase [Aquihabitans sp.]
MPDRAPGRGRIVVDADGTVLDADPDAAAHLGQPVDALVGRSVADVLGSGADGVAVVAAVGHELRSPLTSIRGYTSLLLNRWDRLGDDDKRMMLGQINHDAERVTRLINELLEISRLESGRLSLARRPVDVGELARHVVERVGVSVDDLDAELRFPADLPQVSADADKLEQVLTNLVENAVKYGSPVGMQIEGAVVEGAGDAGPCVAVTVRDTGAGIAPGDLTRVFDRWFQREQGRPSGTGLGLWISRGLVEAHGGTLTVESPPGEGAAFTFTVPVDAA